MPATAALSAPPVPPPPAIPERSGEIRDSGAVRRDSVRAQRWTARGAVKVLGEVDVESADLSGLVTVRGGITGGRVTSEGTLDVGGGVRLSASFHSDGTTTIGKALEAADIDVAGNTSASDGIRSTGRVRWTGHLETRGGINADRVEFLGRATVVGAIVARDVSGRAYGNSKIGSIRADRVTLTRSVRLLGGGHVEVLTIEGKDVDLSGVHAHHVRAERIALGPGCQVASVEGTITRRHPTANVGPVSESPRPYGLSR